MIELNRHYAELKDSYLFAGIARRVAAYAAAHPDERILRLGIGDVSLPLPAAVIAALHEGVDAQADAATFKGYLPECGAPFLREAIARHYASRGVALDPSEVFVSSGASDELGDILRFVRRVEPGFGDGARLPRLRRRQRHRGQAHRAFGVGERRRLAPWPDPSPRRI